MNKRQIQLAKALLTVLNDADGQMIEAIIHAEVNMVVGDHVQLAELNAIIAQCDTQGWLTGIPSRFRGKLWNINDAGRAALLEM